MTPDQEQYITDTLRTFREFLQTFDSGELKYPGMYTEIRKSFVTSMNLFLRVNGWKGDFIK